MTRPMTNRWFPYVLVSSTLAATIIASLLAASLIISALAPETPSFEKSYGSGDLFSPIPPGADLLGPAPRSS
jgi:hypothetical protein